jgi:NADH-quinone oxidoreductase subunit H
LEGGNRKVTDVLVILAKTILAIGIALLGFAYMTLMERKVVGRLQARIGPNRVGPFGILQPLADGIKLVFKEDVIPLSADRIIYTLAPIISASVALTAFTLIPWGPRVNVFGYETPLAVSDTGLGILLFFAVGSLGVYGIVLAGWSSGNKFALLGGMRSAAQLVSYELALGTSVLGAVMVAGSLRLTEIVEAQRTVPLAIVQPLGFLLFLICAIAETNRAPFDLPEAEQELTAGYMTEYSGIRWALFFLAEYVNVFSASLVASVLFLGGWYGPLAPGPHWLLLKVLVLIFVFIWIRATLPRFRYDRLMKFGWLVLMPAAVLNTFITGLVILATRS